MEKLNQSRLYKALCDFKGANGKIDNLTAQFEDIAKAAFYTGHFLVNDTNRIYITDIEFYYHEDNGAIKDEVKYHRNDKKETLPYFPIGSLHPHQSGVDITFENPNCSEQYRASFLIRGYEIRDTNYNCIYKNEISNKTRPTYLWDDLFGETPFLSLGHLNLRWIDEDDKTAEQHPPLTDYRVHIKPEKNHNWRYSKTSKTEK